jgi:hypothetical protein
MRYKYLGTEGCLPCSADSVSKSESSSFEGGETAWKAGTLPLSYSRIRKLHVNSTPN